MRSCKIANMHSVNMREAFGFTIRRLSSTRAAAIVYRGAELRTASHGIRRQRVP